MYIELGNGREGREKEGRCCSMQREGQGVGRFGRRIYVALGSKLFVSNPSRFPRSDLNGALNFLSYLLTNFFYFLLYSSPVDCQELR